MGLSNDVFTLPKNSGWLPLALFANDDLDQADLDSLTLDAADYGLLRVIDGTVYYKPFEGYVGDDTFTYSVTENGILREASVTVVVTPAERQEQNYYDSRIAEELPTSQTPIVLSKVAQFPLQDGANQRFNSFDVTKNGRYFVSTDGTQDGEGLIYEMIPNGDGTFTTELWFDAGPEVFGATGRDIDNSNYIFGGLRGIAFHPEFETNGKFYVTMMEQIPEDPEGHNYIGPIYDDGQNGDSVVAEFTVDPSTGDVIEGSYRELFRVSVPVDDHPIRQLTFNPHAEPGDEDYGLLYVAHGDGSIQSATSGGGQRNDALGKILRVDPLEDGTAPYTVPDTNPFTDTETMPDEVYATGFRNPHTLSFSLDEAGNSHLIVADVGRDNFEEINVVEAGGNYGWSVAEGFFSLNNYPGTVVGIEPLTAEDLQTAIDDSFIFPASFVGHFGYVTYGPDGTPIDGQVGGGQAIASGHAISTESVLKGAFIFGDFAKGGRFYEADLDALLAADTSLEAGETTQDLSWVTPAHMPILFDHDGDPDTTPIVYSSILDLMGKTRSDIRFGQGPNGEMYITTKRDGTVYEVTNARPDSDDVLFGTDGANVLFGYGGDDRLFGEGGADTIILSDGTDIVEGGLGADTFEITDNTERDIIRDFYLGYDMLDLSAFETQSIDVTLIENGVDIDLVRGDTGAVVATLEGAVDRGPTGPLANRDAFFPFDADIAAAGAAGLILGTPATGTGVLNNDGDPDSNIVTLHEVAGAPENIGAWVPGSAGGQFRILSDGTVQFADPEGTVPVGTQTGISYTIVDGDGLTATAEVSLLVEEAPIENTVPVAADDFFRVSPDAAGAYVRLGAVSDDTTLLANDFDAEGAELSIIAINDNGFNVSEGNNIWFDGSNGGQFRVSSSGVIDFYFTEEEVEIGGISGFDYTIVDPLQGSSTATVEVYWGGYANDDFYELSSEELADAGTSMIAVGRTNDGTTALDNDFADATITAINGDANNVGQWVDASDGGQFRVFATGVVQFRAQGAPVEVGSPTSIDYTIAAPDATGDSLTATISLQAVAPPVAVQDDSFSVTAEALAAVGSSWFRLAAVNDGTTLLANDADGFIITDLSVGALGDGTWFDGSNGGQFRVSESGVVDFRNQGDTLTAGETTSFEYTASDGIESQTATVSLTVDAAGLAVASPWDDTSSSAEDSPWDGTASSAEPLVLAEDSPWDDTARSYDFF